MDDTDEMTIPWGKHKGAPVSKVPLSYLCWMYFEADKVSNSLREAIRRHVLSLFDGVPNERIQKLENRYAHDLQQEKNRLNASGGRVEQVYRSLCREFHPDKNGGNGAAMVAINRFKMELDK